MGISMAQKELQVSYRTTQLKYKDYNIRNKEALPDQWKESIIVPIHKMGDKTDCNNYHGI
jgi:hypothetical protein